MFLRRFNWLAVSVAAMLALAGCQKKTTEIGGTPRQKVPVVVSLSPSTSELVGKLSFSNMLAGRTSACNHPNSIAPAQIVLQGTTPNYEKIAQIKPDLIVFDPALFSQDEVAKIEGLGAETMPFTAENLDQYMDYCYRLASTIGGETMMSEYLDDVYAASEAAKAAAPADKVRAVILMGSGGRYMAAGKDSFVGKMLADSGGDVIGPDGKLFAEMSVESIIAANPELIIASGAAQEILSDPRFASTPAVKTKRVVNIDADVLLRTGSRIDTLYEAFSALVTNTAGGR